MSFESTASFMSFFIPVVPRNWNEMDFCRLFADKCIGEVDRVDFFDMENKEWTLSAFVHLKSWEYNEYTDQLYFELDSVYGAGQWYLDVPGQPGMYFILKKMISAKIPDTRLNIHQLAAKVAYLEEMFVALTIQEEVQDQDEEMTYDEIMEDGEIREDDVHPLLDNDEDSSTDFVDMYDATPPVTMATLVAQTAGFDSYLDIEMQRLDCELSALMEVEEKDCVFPLSVTNDLEDEIQVITNDLMTYNIIENDEDDYQIDPCILSMYRAIQKVGALTKVVKEDNRRRERMDFTAELCGNN